MKLFLLSDIHADFWIYEWNKKFNPITDDCTMYFNMLFTMFFKPADAIVIAGDIANDEYIQIAFLKYIATKYDTVYYCFGNHDYSVKGATVFNTGHKVKYSEDRETLVINELKAFTNVKFLNSAKLVDNFISGTYGACDLTSGWQSDSRSEKLHRYKEWYDCKTQKWHNYNFLFRPSVDKLFNWQNKIMTDCVQACPKIFVTHFAPSQIGCHKLYENSSSNAFFYFDGKKLLNAMQDGTIWICGHIHSCAKTEYTNADGNKITIIASPLGYPGDDALDNGFTIDYSKDMHGEGHLISYTPDFRLIEI